MGDRSGTENEYELTVDKMFKWFVTWFHKLGSPPHFYRIAGKWIPWLAALFAILTVAGVHDILTKQLGSNNPHNVVKAAMAGIKSLRTVEQVAVRRGISVPEVYGLRGGAKE